MITKTFGLIGAAGFVAPRHLKAIRDTGSTLAAALDPHDSVGILDSYFPEAQFFSSLERFERHIEKLRLAGTPLDYMSVCSPNYLHDTHIRLGLHAGANVICEKPLVINPWNLDALEETEAQTGKRVNTVLQLRLLPTLMDIKRQLEAEGQRERDVVLTYITRRGQWYHTSWKGDEEKSGGLAVNIGIHLFDLLYWLFGAVEHSEVHLARPDKMAGFLHLARARVRWYLSVDSSDLPAGTLEAGRFAYRSITLDGTEIEFSEGFGDLHTRVYEKAIAGEGFRIADARPSIEMVYRIRESDVTTANGDAHPLIKSA
jgi:UDP-N-acetyl-2-amino-2-deoxyglucuronate dehydrogenase